MDVDVERLDKGDGLEASTRRHHASWHKTCRLKFNQTQLDRLARRKEEEEIAEARKMETAQEEGANFDMRTRSSIGRPDYKGEIFFTSVMSHVALQDFTILALVTSTGRFANAQ